MRDMGRKFDSIIVSKLDREIKINLDEIENKLTKLRYEKIVKDSEIDEIEKAVSNIIKAIDETAKKQVVTNAKVQELTANIDKH